MTKQALNFRSVKCAGIWLTLGLLIGSTPAATFCASQPQSVADSLESIVDQARARHDTTEWIKALLSLGDLETRTNDYERAATHYFNAARLGEEAQLAILQGTAYNSIGINYFTSGDLERAKKFIRRAVALQRDAGAMSGYAIALSNLAALLTLADETNEALEFLREAESLLSQANDQNALAQVYNILGATHRLHTGHLDSAALYYQQYFDLVNTLESQEGRMVALYNLGELDLLLGNARLGEQRIREALAISEKSKRDSYRLDIYNTLADLLAEQARFEEAFDYRSKAYTLNDSLFRADAQRTISELEMRYETERNERMLRDRDAVIRQQQLDYERARRGRTLLIYAITIMALVIGFVFFWRYSKQRSKVRSEQEKTKFYQNIAHEIKTPLTLIESPVQELLKKVDKEHQRELGFIRDNAQRLKALVDELLDLERIDQGQFEVAITQGDPVAHIRQIVEAFQSAHAATGKRCIFSSSHTEAMICAWPADALTRIMNNLLSNAIKYGKTDGEVIVRANLEGSDLKLSVCDDGQGIPKKEQKRIFKRHYRMKQHRDVTGMGIGLSYVSDLLEALNGTIEVESAEGRGSCFSVSLPVQPMMPEQVFVEPVESDSRPVLLIVEDQIQLADFVQGLFTPDWRTVVARDGDEGIQMALALLPDVVLSDVMMPRKDGIELLKTLKTDALTRHIPIVLFSARSALAHRLKGLSAGADAYVPKPFDADELRLTVRNLLQTIRHAAARYREGLRRSVPFENRVRSEHAFINNAVEAICAHLDDSRFGVNELAAQLSISRSQLHRKLHSLSGCSTTQFIRTIRLEYARDLLQQPNLNIAEIAYQCGFNSPGYFTTTFTEYFKKSPTDYRAGLKADQ